MPRCQPIALLKLDSRSLEGVKRIKRLQNTAKWGTTLFAGSKITDILFMSGPPDVMHNISTQDWENFFGLLISFPKAFIRQIENVADYQVLDHFACKSDTISVSR